MSYSWIEMDKGGGTKDAHHQQLNVSPSVAGIYCSVISPLLHNSHYVRLGSLCKTSSISGGEQVQGPATGGPTMLCQVFVQLSAVRIADCVLKLS